MSSFCAETLNRSLRIREMSFARSPGLRNQQLCLSIVLSVPFFFSIASPASSQPTCPMLWQPPQTLPGGARASSVLAADFNSDGNMDLAMSSYDDSKIMIAMGDGTGNFLQPSGVRVIGVGVNSESFAIGDFNQDNNPDIVVACYNNSSLYVLLGAGDGTFPTQVLLPIVYNSTSVIVKDLNNDGRADIAAVCRNGNNSFIAILRGNNNLPGSLFFAAEQSPTIPNAMAIAPGDFNQDGKVDLAVLVGPVFNQGYFAVSVNLLLGNGNGTFVSGGSTSVPNTFWCGSIMAADFDADGFDDIALASTDTDSVIVMQNTGGALKPQAFYLVGDQPGYLPLGMTIVDINNDGQQDIITSIYGDGGVRILLGTGSGDFSRLSKLTAGFQPWGILVTDLNNDGRKDIVVANRNGNSALTYSVLKNITASGPQITTQPQPVTAWNGRDVSFLISATNAVSYQWRRNGTSLSDTGGIAGTQSATLSITQVSIANEGNYDCVVGNGCGTVTSAAASLTVNPPCLGDFNRDGHFNGLDIETVVALLLEGDSCYPCK